MKLHEYIFTYTNVYNCRHLVFKLLSIFKDVGSLTRENEVLKGKTMCKICGQRQVKLVFIPCGHLVCCLECGQQMAHCPVCSSAITKHFPVYLWNMLSCYITCSFRYNVYFIIDSYNKQYN